MIVLECAHKCGDTGALHIKVEINVDMEYLHICNKVTVQWTHCQSRFFFVVNSDALFCVSQIYFFSWFFAGTSLASTLIGTRYETEWMCSPKRPSYRNLSSPKRPSYRNTSSPMLRYRDKSSQMHPKYRNFSSSKCSWYRNFSSPLRAHKYNPDKVKRTPMLLSDKNLTTKNQLWSLFSIPHTMLGNRDVIRCGPVIKFGLKYMTHSWSQIQSFHQNTKREFSVHLQKCTWAV